MVKRKENKLKITELTLVLALEDAGADVTRGFPFSSKSSLELSCTSSASEATTPLTKLELGHPHSFTESPQKSHLKGQSIKVWPSVKPQTIHVFFLESAMS